MCAVLESHGKPICHDLFVSVGRLDAQLVELQELCGVDSTVIARRQVWLELAGPDDAAKLGGEGAATRGGHWSPSWRWSLVLVPTRCRGRRRAGIPKSKPRVCKGL